MPAPTPPPLGFDPSRLCSALSNGKPLVAALHGNDLASGHIVVVIGAEYQAVVSADSTAPAEVHVMAVKFWDPAKNNPNLKNQFGGEHWLSGSEFAKHCDFIASEDDARGYLEFMRKYSDWQLKASGADKPNP